MKTKSALFVCVLLSACSATFYSMDPAEPKAGLRVATDLGGNTNFNIGSRSSCEEKEFGPGLLGWFHPMAGSMQAGRRGIDKRIGLAGGDAYKSNMQAEHYISVAEQPRFNIGNISGYTYGVISTLNSCDGFFDIDMEAGKSYEILASKNDEGCTVKAYELVSSGAEFKRVELEVVRACL